MFGWIHANFGVLKVPNSTLKPKLISRFSGHHFVILRTFGGVEANQLSLMTLSFSLNQFVLGRGLKLSTCKSKLAPVRDKTPLAICSNAKNISDSTYLNSPRLTSFPVEFQKEGFSLTGFGPDSNQTV